MQIEKNFDSALSPADTTALIRQARYERSLAFSALASKIGKTIGKFLLGANHSLIEMSNVQWSEEVSFHDRQAQGTNDVIDSKADHDCSIDQASPILPFAAMRTVLKSAKTDDAKIAA